MDIHTFNGKRKIGSTDLNDFTDFQGIGHDPLYRRYNSLRTLVDQVIEPEYADFLAVPVYDEQNGMINWYVPEWNEVPQRLSDLGGAEKARYEQIKQATISHYRSKLGDLSGDDLRIMGGALRYINDDFIYCADGRIYAVAWGMTPDNDRHVTMGELVSGSPKKPLDFTPPPVVPPADPGQPVPPALPPVEPLPEEPPMAVITFDPGKGAQIKGNAVVQKPMGSMLDPADIPTVIPPKNATFTGWDFNPLNTIVKGNLTFHATYNKRKGKPWWWWLLIILGPLLALFLLLWLLGCFRSCTDDVHKTAEKDDKVEVVKDVKEVNGVVEPPVFVSPDGDTLDYNGPVAPIVLIDGKLPAEEVITPPVFGDDGLPPSIIREPGVPPVFGDRLIIFLEDEDADIDAFADEFKKAYPEEEYQIIGFDKYVKSLVIQVPDSKREALKSEIEQKIPGYNFIVFDESIYEYNAADSSTSTSPKGWHLQAVKAQQGWNITKGSRSVKVAVVDDGIDRSHAMFSDRIESPYNVFTRNNQLSNGIGHGTMVAGLAVGSIQNASAGAAGIAPDCSLIPVQVSDNAIIPLSALVSGIMYAVHQGADVVNVSIAPQLQGLNMFPVEEQMEISRREFLNVAKLWDRVCKVAAQKNCIIVFAAGNDDILSSIPPENRNNNCIVVGAVDEKLYPTVFTNYGVCTDISAPGEGIYSSYPVNSFNSMDGTSFAAPIVTGTVALMRSLDKNITVEQAKNVLYRTGKQVYGSMPPMVQVPEALQGVKNKDFSRGPDRGYIPVPEDAGRGGSDRRYESWTVPDDPGFRTYVDPSPGVNPGEFYDGRVSPGVPPGTGSNPQPFEPEEDYSYIRRRIKQLQDEIKELEKQLPENR